MNKSKVQEKDNLISIGSNNQPVYFGEVREIIEGKEGKSSFGFICNHNYHDDGYNKDIFFSFKSIDTSDKISKDDWVSFKIGIDKNNNRIWAKNVRLLRRFQDEQK